jgi:hypothetical protein
VSDNYLVAEVQDSHRWYTGSGLIEAVMEVTNALDEGRWVDAALSGFMGGLEGVGAFMDPLGAIASTGVSWLIEAIDPLREYLDDLTGDTDVLAAHAATWDNMAIELEAVKADLEAYVESDVADWSGAAAEAYRTMMGNNVDGTGGLAGLCSAMRAATEGAATLVSVTRDLVLMIISELVATLLVRLPVWLGLIATGFGIPVVAYQATGMALNVGSTITGILIALVTSFQGLQQLLDS